MDNSKILQNKIKDLLTQGEGLALEFKECKTAINKDIYETVCAFLNRSGGELLLGARDDGKITGIDQDYIPQVKNDFVIDHEKLFTENSNKPHGFGLIDPVRFTPYPKNPSIARVFKEIGRADELGSGVRNLFKYCREYCGHDPQLMEEEVFRFVLPLTAQATTQATAQAKPSSYPSRYTYSKNTKIL